MNAKEEAPRLLDQVRNEIRLRHYSIRTEQTYTHWVVRFVRFHGLRHPRDMGAPEINAFLTHLAVHDNVTAATQNQALSALVFLYRPGTLRLYRHILRDLRKFLRDRHSLHHPGNLTRDLADAYLSYLAEQNVSWSWLANVIAVLRNCFDRLGNMDVTVHMVTPRRKWPLPETLSSREVRQIFDVLPNPRDRLLVALLSGCGLRVSEACRVRWADFDAGAATLRIEDPSGLRSRIVPVPQDLLSLFQGLAAISRSTDPMLVGRLVAKGDPRGLGVRQAERIIQKAGLRSGVLKRINPTNLRSTYAHCRLLAGHNIRAVQEAMGHRSVKTTLRYQACILPSVTSPLDPESQEMVLRQMNALLGRLSMALPALQSTKPQGP